MENDKRIDTVWYVINQVKHEIFYVVKFRRTLMLLFGNGFVYYSYIEVNMWAK